MDAVLAWLFGAAGFPPPGARVAWPLELLALHGVSDGLFALSSFAIAGMICWFLRRRTLAPERRRLILLLAVFIAACGATHLVSVLTLWEPVYGLQGVIKAVTAALSLAVAVSLPFLLPKLLRLPTAAALEAANQRLQAEADAHSLTMAALEDARDRLERQVAERDEELRYAAARFMRALSGSGVSVIEQGEDLVYVWVFNSRYVDPGVDVAGKNEHDFMEPQTAERLRAIKREVLATGELRELEFHIAPQGEPRWIHLRLQPTVLRDGRRGILGMSMDITELKRQQQHLELVMRELNHRSKNLLTIVQSIARQTASGLDVPDAFLTRLSERLRALAAAHDVLVAGDWRGADMRAVIESQLRHQLDAASGRIRLKGERFELPPEMAHYIGLAVHELGANAAKYGALSSGEGLISVEWRMERGADQGRSLHLEWRETEGPATAATEFRGFGRTILEVLTPRALGGRSELRFDPEGVCWVLDAPLPER